MKRILAILLVIAMLMGMALTTAVAAETTTLPDVNSEGYRTATTDGIEITEEGIYVTFTSTTLSSATTTWSCPVYLVYGANDSSYTEYWYQRADNFGWECTSGNWYNNWSDGNPATLAGTGVTYHYTDCTNWDTWLDTLKAGVEVSIYAHLINGYAVITMSCNGITTTVYVRTIEGETPYINLSGEACTLTNIQVTSADRNHYELEDTSVNWFFGYFSEGIEITESPVTVTFTGTAYAAATETYHCPLWILYTSENSAVNGIGYVEYWVQLANNYGWNGDLNRWSGDEALAAAGITCTAEDNANWDTFVADMQAGQEGTITAYLDGDTAIITFDYNGIVSTFTRTVDVTKPVYLSLSGEQATVSNITVCYHDNTDVKNTASESCTDDGYTGDTYCADCGKLLQSGEPIPAKGHTNGTPVKENEVAPDCTTDGTYDTVVYCSDCGAEISRTGGTTPAINHSWGEVTYTWNDDHTACTATRTCGNDATHVETAQAEITSVSTATCNDDGQISYTATFTEDWAETQTDSIFVAATGDHIYANFVERVPATCTEDGYEVYACGCGETKNTVLAKTGHNEGTPVKENEVAPSCTNKGSYDTVTYCTKCDAELNRETTVVDANGHTNATPVKENEKAPSCTEKGGYDTVTYCAVCGEELNRETTTIEATGHTNAAPVKENQVAATCTEKGSYDNVTYCSVCEAEQKRETVVVNATGHSFLNGNCSVCGAEDPNYVEGTLDCPGWWVAHTDGIKLTEAGVTIACKSTTYADAANNWNGILYVLYTNSAAKIDNASADYSEYWVQRVDNYGWNAAANRWSGDEALAAAGIAYTVDETAADWNNFLASMKEGIDVTITAKLDGNKAVITMTANGLITTVTADVDTAKDVYLSLTGELCTLTDIVVTANETDNDPTEPEATEPEATEPEATVPEATEPEATEPEATEPEATEPEAPSISDVDDLDCPSWWAAHTEGVEITANGVEINATNVTYATAANNWNGPLWILYTGNEPKVNGAGYIEYWVQRGDNYGWCVAGQYYNVDLNRWSDAEELAAYGIYITDAFAEGFSWDNFLNDLKAGAELKVSAKLVGENAVITTEIAGITNNITLPVDTDNPVYLSLSGELCTLSDITITTHETVPDDDVPSTEPEATEPEATEPEATVPEATEPEATEPEATEPEATEPEATTPAAPTVTDLGDVDCEGWWTAHSAGVAVDTYGVTITMDSKTYETGTNNWNAPIFILYSGDEAKVNGAGYYEYWVHRADNYGWAGGWGNFLNTGANMAELNALGVTVEGAYEDGCWDNWVADLQAGVECTVTAKLVGSNAIVSIECNGVTNTITVPVDASKPLYLSVSGELCTLSNITATSHKSTAGSNPSQTGDSIAVFVALMAVSAMGIAVISKKKEF